jgi:hypothetical protein
VEGLFKNPNLKIEYLGKFLHGKKHGFGQFTFASKDVYVGDFFDGKI